jgi:hypothetical protein
MGIYIDRAEDQTLYDNLWEEVQRIIHASKEEIRKTEVHKSSDLSKKNNDSGYCIRTGVIIPFDLEKPMSKEAYQQWKQYANYTFKEKFCHFSGEPSHGETSMEKPILSKHWKKAQAKHGFK